MRILETAISALKDRYLCDNCLGRLFGDILSGYTNKERGSTIRMHIAMSLDSGEDVSIDRSNLSGIKFRHAKIQTPEKKQCSICGDFFSEKIDELARKTAGKLIETGEASKFTIGSVPTNEMKRSEEKLWEEVGVENVEPLKSEINREVGKRVQEITGKEATTTDPDVVIVIDMEKGQIRKTVKSLFVYGEYSKLARGIPQTKWVCNECGGKGCRVCGGEGKRYKTSVQEIVEKPFLKEAGSHSSSFHGGGREDVDARNLGYRPFVIEITKPVKRSIDLKKIEKAVNKSKKVKIRKLRFVEKDIIVDVKSAKNDKTYEALVEFEKDVDKKKLLGVKSLNGMQIRQKTPTRVMHRRADKLRKRTVKKISFKQLSKRKIKFSITGEAGLYIKELISGDEGRTNPSVADILGNKVKKIELDVTKIHS